MSDMWRCQNGHSGRLDKPEYGGPPTLPTGCPFCGARIVSIPPSSLGDLDRTLAPEQASNVAPETTLTVNTPSDPLDVLGSTLHLDDNAPLPNTTPDATLQDRSPSEPIDSTDFILNVGSGQPDGTLNISGKPSPMNLTTTLAAADAPEVPLHQTVVLRPSVRTGGPYDANQAASQEGQTLDIHAGNLLPGANRVAPPHIADSTDKTVAIGPGQEDAARETMAPDQDANAPPTVKVPSKSKSRVRPGIAGYEVLLELGRGGMGVVYKARQVSLNRLVALKMILAANLANAKDLARFQIEAEAVAQLVHPNIVQIYEIGEREGCPFFSLEFVAGGTLADHTGMTPQPPARAARIVRALASAMDFAHRRGIIHRDLKPANVLLALPENVPPPDADEPFPLDVCIPKITDFGLAKRLEGDSGHTHDGAILGTPNYMAPEQARGQTKRIGPAADIYALGSILYDLLTGMPPFQGSTVMETLEWVVSREPVPPRTVNALVPSDLSTICLKCLEKDPSKRYATAGDLAEDLRRYLEGEPILARPSSWLERSVKWSRRRPTTAALIGVCVLTVLAMSVGGVAFALYERHMAAEENKLRTEADDQRDKAEKNRRAAEANFLEACKAVDDMLLQVGSQRLAAEPRMENIRRELLDKAARFYAKHLQDTGPDSLLAVGNDPNVRWRAARSSYQLGRIEQILGHNKEAEGRYLFTVQLLGKLRDEFPTDQRYRQDLATAHYSLGELYNDLRQLTKAEEEYQQAQDLRQALANEDGGNAAYQFELALSAFGFGQVEMRRGRLAAAKKALKTALELTQQLPNANEPQTRQHLARIYNSMGHTLQDLGQPDEAQKAYEQARDTLTELAQSDRRKAMPEYREELAVTYNNLGQLLRDTNPAAAEIAYNEALKLTISLVDDFPSTPTYGQEEAVYLNNLALLFQAKGDTKKAEEHYLLALSERRELATMLSSQPDYRRDYAEALRNRGLQLLMTGRLDGAKALNEEDVEIHALVKEYSGTPDYQRELGNCLYGQAALQAVLHQTTEAETLFREALNVFQKLADQFPDQPDYRSDLAATHANLAALLAPEEAEKEYHAAIAEFKRLVSSPADTPDYELQLALAERNLGDLLSKTKHGAEAYPYWKAARDLLEPLAERYRGVPVYRRSLGQCYNQYPVQLILDGKARAAEEAWQKARVVQQELVDQFPTSAEDRLNLARTLANLANVSATLNQLGDAAKLFRQAVQVLEEYKGRDASTPAFRTALLNNAKDRANFLRKLAVTDQEALDAQMYLIRLRQKEVDAAPDNLDQLGLLATEQDQLALLLVDANVSREGRVWLEKAVENQHTVAAKLPNEAKPRANLRLFTDHLVQVYARLDEHALVARDSAKLLKLSGTEPLPRAEAAARLAGGIAAVDRDQNLSGVERVVLRLMYAEQAMQYLQDAAQHGFKDAATIKRTEAFAPLHQRADYQELLRKMEMGTP